MTDRLLAEVTAINKKYALINQKTGAYFNIFDIIEKSSDEVVICKFLHELLNPNGSHYQGDVFLRLFAAEVLQIDFTEQDYKSARVFKEHTLNGRRIDLFIETINYRIPIEVKIYAGDQDRQCFDYYKQAKNANVYYLTLYGSLPSEASADGLTPEKANGEITGYKEVSLISFGVEIINWLNRCLALPDIIKIAPIREILLQFKDVICISTGQTEGGAKMDIIKAILLSSETMNSALDIEKALPEAKSAVTKNLLGELKRRFELNGNTVLGYNERSIDDYYISRNMTYPGFSVKIAELTDNIFLAVFVEIYWDLYFGFAFAEKGSGEKPLVYIKRTDVKKKHPDKYNEFASAVTEVTGEGKQTPNAIFWDRLLSDKGLKYDFKNFAPPCVDLMDDYIEQAGNMFDMLNGYIQAVSKRLNGI